ncbi:MAG: hypothetical protein OEO79_03390 [Gemmatimonadota bacterium]|nr:hypothetical protein [Gemmatimonadota bacterium]MDH3422162.1 hypothetical protein [Gemmatimonadota bacterium]
MKRGLIVAAAVLAVGACGEGAGDAQTAVDTLTRRQKDSLISIMPIPGAGAVGKALDVQDLTRQRGAELDSLLR